MFDGCYEVGKLEAVLKLYFDTYRMVFNHSYDLSYAKIAVTGTLISDISLIIFFNYNGAIARYQNISYKYYRPKNISDKTYI